MSKFKIQIILSSILIGVFSGACSSAFLHSLEYVTHFRDEHKYLIWGLPVFGLLFGYLIKSIPHHINQGVPYLIHELDNHGSDISPWMTPFIFLGSLGTHLFGGSAGREGVGVIMGASIAHAVPRMKRSYKELRPYLIYSGLAAGFSSIFGTPLAAIIFAFELHQFKDLKKGLLIFSVILSSIIAFLMPFYFGPAHQHFTVNFHFAQSTVIYVLIAAIASGLGGLVFYWGLKSYTKVISKLVPQIEWKLAVGALLVSIIVYTTGAYDYIGIGTSFIEKAFHNPSLPYDFIMKCLLTVMTLAVGFKGGEVTPLFFMGATLSNSFSTFFNLNNYALSSALGMVGLFGAVTATPIASAVMAAEMFGGKVGLLAIAVCLIARLIMRNKSVYRL